jgi:catechol 2,3-dioxygenase-like lactoylglutathione lyase family enzyme
MIGYVTLGTNQFEKAAAFYDALLGELGAKRVMEIDRLILWGAEPGKPMLAICKPFDGKAATVGNGTMVALAMPSQDAVRKFHAKALELGGTDEGAPGPRADGSFFGGYFRDLDGNKLVAFIIGG